MDENEYQALIEKRGLHGLVLALSTESIEIASSRDLWLRSIILILATVLAIGSVLVWQNLVRVSDLQIRLVRASEMNTHLKEMNLAAAGLAHETRNPLNIIRGIAHMISKQPDAAPEIRNKTRDIIDEADKVAAQLNEFINYSRPREVRRTTLPLGSVVNEVVRTLNYDLEEKHIKLQVQGEQLSCVVIDRLPFAVPTDPVIEARVNAIRQSGGNHFYEYQIPQAALALKQGFGRLIRAATDRGVLALLDNRITKLPYGRVFFDSLPAYRFTNKLTDVQEFFHV